VDNVEGRPVRHKLNVPAPLRPGTPPGLVGLRLPRPFPRRGDARPGDPT
jgi:hypothetical protein